MRDWYQHDRRDVLDALEVDPAAGLSDAEAARRLARFGTNELPERGGRRPWRILWEQVSGLLVVLLLLGGAISAAVGDLRDAAAIGAIVILNVALGFNQEYRAERAMAALKRLAVPLVQVRRGGAVRELPAAELVPGDLVLLDTGDRVPADGRLLVSINLRVQEAVLSGEAEAVEKDAAFTASGALPVGDRRNLVFQGTAVTYGRGEAVITATGARTELGRIAAMMQSVGREQTPLQRRLDGLGRTLAAAALAIVAAMVGLGLLRGEETRLLLLTAISLAVAAVPEGLPAVVTVALALGARRLLQRRALIRKLAAVETLGSVTVICSDKTGTLTENQMAVAVLATAGCRLDLIDPASSPGHDRARMVLAETPALALLVAGGALCNDATLAPNQDGGDDYQAVGEPTEVALVEVAAELGLPKPELEEALPRVAEYPFDSERKRMTTVHTLPPARTAVPLPLAMALRLLGVAPSAESLIAFTKGAVESLLEVASGALVEGRARPLDGPGRAEIAAAHDTLARAGMRVLGVAFRRLEERPPPDLEDAERDLTFVGLVGMIDPPRAGAREAVQSCMAAGIRPVMITGDHPLTARYVAAALGMAPRGKVLTGQELDACPAGDLQAVVEEVEVLARVSPEHKLRFVQALRARGEIVAMTGDGVNDAPALQQADIGIAMGITGTDVAKEASDLVLLDDNFATIVAAVAEGRVIYDNIRKFIGFMLGTNAGELWVMLLAPALGMPLPLLPLQILWVNLVTDGPPALALAVEPAERDTMRRPPHPPGESILARGLGWHVLWLGLFMGLVSLGPALLYWRDGREEWRTLLFTTLVLAQMANVLAARSERRSLLRMDLLSNPPLVGAVLLTVALQLAVIYVPFLQSVFATSPLPPGDLLLSATAASSVFWAVEVEKWFLRRGR